VRFNEVLLSLHVQQLCSLLAVVHGIKPSAIIESVLTDYWRAFVDFIKIHRLSMAYSTERGLVIFDRGRRVHYIDKDLLAKEDFKGEILDSDAVFSLKPISDTGIDYRDIYVSRSKDILLEILRYHLLKKTQKPKTDLRLGELLGYPECCVRNYVELGPVKAWYNYQRGLIESGLDQQMPVELWAIYHAPCSATCKASIELGGRYLMAVKKTSEKLYRKVVSELSSSHLAYSIGRRFLDFHETKRSIEPYVEKFVAERLPEPYYILYGKILRPFIYCKWEKEEFKLNITREIEGYKYIAYSPGEGVLVFDSSLKVHIYLTKKILGNKSIKYSSTAFRIYRVNRPTNTT